MKEPVFDHTISETWAKIDQMNISVKETLIKQTGRLNFGLTSNTEKFFKLGDNEFTANIFFSKL